MPGHKDQMKGWVSRCTDTLLYSHAVILFRNSHTSIVQELISRRGWPRLALHRFNYTYLSRPKTIKKMWELGDRNSLHLGQCPKKHPFDREEEDVGVATRVFLTVHHFYGTSDAYCSLWRANPSFWRHALSFHSNPSRGASSSLTLCLLFPHLFESQCRVGWFLGSSVREANNHLSSDDMAEGCSSWD